MAQLGRIWADGIWNTGIWNNGIWAQVGSNPSVTASYLVMTNAKISPDDKMYVRNDLLFSCTLQDDLGALIASGTVELTIKDSNAQEVSGITWPLALSHAGAGLWTVVVDSALAAEYLKKYAWEISASSNELDGFWKKVYDATFRGFE